MPAREIADVFATWNEGELRSYLIEITARVLERVDEETGQPLVDLILDEAQQKGTGKWMSQNAFDVGAPIPTVNAAVEARLLSALKSERVAASSVLQPGPSAQVGAGFSRGDRAIGSSTAARQALLCAQDHLLCAGHGAAAAGVARVQVQHRSRARSRESGGRAASSARRCSRTSAPPSAETRRWST